MTRVNISRLVAVVTTAALLCAASIAPARAAALVAIDANGGTTLAASATITTVHFTPITALTNGSTVVVSYDANIVDTGLVAGDIAVTNTGGTFGASTVDTVANTITIPVTTAGTGTSVVTLTFSNAHFKAPATGVVTIGVGTSVGDTGAVAIYVAGANQVTIGVNVTPMLSMTLANTVTFLGSVGTTRINSGAATTLTVSTNATSGYTLTANAVPSDATNMNIQNASALNNTTAPGFALYGTSGANASGNFVSSGIANTVNLHAGAQAIAHATVPIANDATVVGYSAQGAALTPAGNYTLTTTYTVTGGF